MMLTRLLACLSLALVLLPVASAQASPGTQADGDLTIDAKHQKDIDHDIEEGKKYAEQVEKQEKVSKDQAMQDRVQRVGAVMANLANHTHLIALWGDKRFSKYDYTFKVLTGKDTNAFSLPGGHIYVYEGLMKFVQSDDELAAVLGHEITHAALRHVPTLEREATKAQAIELPLILAAILKGGQAGGNVAIGAQLGIQGMASGWSIKAEVAADYGGFQLMCKSPYNPTACLTTQERLAEIERNSPQIDWGIFRDHPPSPERAAAIMEDLKKAKIPIQRSAVTTSFCTTLKKTPAGIEAWFDNKVLYTFAGDDAEERAEATRKRLNAFFDSVPAMADVSVQGSRIVARDGTLLEIEPSDATHANETVSSLADKTLTSIKGAVFNLAYQVWQP